MLDRASAMPNEERKAYAEKVSKFVFCESRFDRERQSSTNFSAFTSQVAIAFWRAIGGDEDEVAGLDDDCDWSRKQSVAGKLPVAYERTAGLVTPCCSHLMNTRDQEYPEWPHGSLQYGFYKLVRDMGKSKYWDYCGGTQPWGTRVP